MRTLAKLTALALVCFAPAAHAQFVPPPEMAKFDVTLGNWQLEGTVTRAPGAEPVPWTGVSTWYKPLSGHFVIEDMKLTGGGMPGEMLWRTVYSWDGNDKVYRRFSFSNTGTIESGPMHWAGTKLISSTTVSRDGITMTDHGSSAFDGDTMTLDMVRSTSGGEFTALVRGTGKRGGEGVTFGATDSAVAPVSAEMKKAHAQHGTYTLKGEMRPLPGMPNAVPVSGRETIRPILGGHVNLTEIQGDPAPGTTMAYEGRMMIGWDAQRGRYRAVEIGSFGEYNEHDIREVGDKQVWTSSPVLYGQPMLLRSVLTVKDEGKTVHVITHRTAGLGPPEVSFEVTATRVED